MFHSVGIEPIYAVETVRLLFKQFSLRENHVFSFKENGPNASIIKNHDFFFNTNTDPAIFNGFSLECGSSSHSLSSAQQQHILIIECLISQLVADKISSPF